MKFQKPNSHWIHAGLTFFLTVLGAGILLPFFREHPESVHKYFTGLCDWLRISVAFSVCIIFTVAMFRLLSPRIGHLARWRCPPSWLAALIAWFVVAIIDVSIRFDSDGYRATSWEWIGYGGGSVLLVGWYYGLWSDVAKCFRKWYRPRTETTVGIALRDFEEAPWEEIASWLRVDAPARYDFLDNQMVADRVSQLISTGIRSIGIVGPFGAGKTSLVQWASERLEDSGNSNRRYFICHHSCWGFETSSSAIQDMLSSAVSKLGSVVDTFQVDSLPESYRETFSAGGDWLKTVVNLMLRNPDPIEQFRRLSELLEDIGGRIVFIVEDLDRNDTQNFEIQEVLAFLERLKPYPNLSFILTGGLSSSLRIDFAKLCDHIEYLRTIRPDHASRMIECVRRRCLDTSFFTHTSLTETDRNHEWNPLNGILMRDYDELSLPQSVASLLSTPRALRHALGRTFTAWHTLHGEIDFNDLLAVNILRFGAPECFQFLMRRWDRIHSHPNRRPSFGQERLDEIRQAILNDWNYTVQNVEWNPAAALKVMQFILPATEWWLIDSSRHPVSQGGRQKVTSERYWIRAINEAIDRNDVRDQEAIRDTSAWLETPGTETVLVTKLVSWPRYSQIWESLADALIANRDQILLLCQQVITRILCEHGSSACYESQGFDNIWRLAHHRVSIEPENREWLQNRISEAADVSIEMVNALWHFYGDSGQYSILRIEDAEPVRRHVLATSSAVLTSSTALVAKLSPGSSATLFQLVFDPGNNGRRILADVQSWCWLGPSIVDALRNRNVLAASNCAILLGARAHVSAREQVAVDNEVLDQFFGDDAIEVINILDSMIDQLAKSDQMLARNVVEAARRHLSTRVLRDQ